MSYRPATNREFGESPLLGVIMGAVFGAVFYFLLHFYLSGGLNFDFQDIILLGLCPGAFGGCIVCRRGSLIEAAVGGLMGVILVQVVLLLI
jgi:hypothetical protein